MSDQIQQNDGLQGDSIQDQVADAAGDVRKVAALIWDANDNKLDQAAALYTELNGMSDPIVAKESISVALADIYEKQGKKQEAVNVLFDLVKSASEAKDLDGKPVPLSSTATEAKEKLTQLDPEKAKELPQEPADFDPNSLF